MEGCEEHQLIAADKRIDREVSVVFTLLYDNSARRRLIEAQTAWLAYRRADCLSQADVNGGGSLAVVDVGACEVANDKSRSADLYVFYRDLTQGRGNPPAFP